MGRTFPALTLNRKIQNIQKSLKLEKTQNNPSFQPANPTLLNASKWARQFFQKAPLTNLVMKPSTFPALKESFYLNTKQMRDISL